MVSPPVNARRQNRLDFSEFDGRTIAAVFYAPERRVLCGTGSFESGAESGNILRISNDSDVADIIIHEPQFNGRILHGPRFGCDCDFCFVIGEPAGQQDRLSQTNELCLTT